MELWDVYDARRQLTGRTHRRGVPMQPGDVPVTYADTEALQEDFDYCPKTDLRTGLRNFAQWYQEFYGQEENR